MENFFYCLQTWGIVIYDIKGHPSTSLRVQRYSVLFYKICIAYCTPAHAELFLQPRNYMAALYMIYIVYILIYFIFISFLRCCRVQFVKHTQFTIFPVIIIISYKSPLLDIRLHRMPKTNGPGRLYPLTLSIETEAPTLSGLVCLQYYITLSKKQNVLKILIDSVEWNCKNQGHTQ